jgi:tRNA uridine 5-carboxymethylaminomethyl modification enzyme
LLRGITEDLSWKKMKTGTPPRVDGRSLDYSKMNEEKAETGFLF